MNSQSGSTGHTGGGHFMHTVRHVHILNHGNFTDKQHLKNKVKEKQKF
jgi:hypothetical protein